MSYLLGSKACMESLAADVQDVQETIKEVTSRVGPVQARSWKFPDKKACDLDIDDLLDLYDYDGDDADDPEAKQVSHIALYELVIDRLIFLIQAVSKFCSSQFSAGQVGVKQNTNMDIKMAGSVGVIIKQYWTYVVKLQSQYQQLVSENKSKDTKIRELEKERSTSPSDDNLSCPSTSSINTSKSSGMIETPGILGIIPPNNADLVLLGKTNLVSRSSMVSISKDLNNKSSQTFETAFVPCESCDVIQRKLRETGEVIIKVCTDQGLPCSLKKFKAEVSHVEMLSFSDVCRWMVEQNKDVARIGKQSTILQASIDPLKADVKTFEQRTKAAEEKAQTCEKNAKDELDVRTHLCKQYESKLKDQEKHYNELIAEEERQKSELKKNKENLEKEVARVRQEVQKDRDVLRELEESYTILENDLEDKKKLAEQTVEHTQEVAELKSKLADITAALESHSKTLAREQGKSRSANRHNESLQAKQDSLLARMDVLGKENEDLSNQVASLEEEKALLEDTLNTMREETKSLDNKLKENEIIIKDLETEKRNMEKCMREAEMSIQALESELQEVKEREKMMEYPDLNGPVNADLQGSGDVAVDMKNQITANAIRIRILEEQNQTLSQSIQRLSTLRSSPGAKAPSEHVSVKLVPLWQNNSGLLASQRNNNSSHQHNEEWTWNGHSSDKMFSNQQHMGHPDSSDQSKHKQYARTHAKKDEDYSRSYQGSGVRTSPQEFLVSRGNTPTSQLQREDKSLRQQRPFSGKLSSLTAPVNATPIGAYTHMKKALGIMSGKDSTLKGLPPSGKQPLGKTTSYMAGGDTRLGHDGSDDGRSTPFSCPHCDKVYPSSKDLDIHLTYCIQ